MRLKISPRGTVWFLTLVVLFLFCVSGAAHILEHYLKSYESLRQFTYIFWIEINDESIATWYSSFLLLFSSLLLAAISTSKKRSQDRYSRHWGILAFIFLLLSVDEVAEIHEHVGAMGAALATSVGYVPEGFLYFFWFVPYALFLLIVLLAFLRFLSHLPRNTLLLFLGAGAIYVGAALGIELLDSKLSYLFVVQGADIERTVTVVEIMEEVLEMVGAIVFIYALLSYMGSFMEEVTLEMGMKNKK
jgi:hypothetical protein